ncbi:DUF3515 domain-containing protein [Nocardioides sp. 503]|uniref:DUF3515 domain-containing protein n=1 Tax=Nocardioides sp. 503 TaxID=2508326 RepID=UPI00106F8282|nr:DUF3515 domain-containing protein [Nocardioides sp. 503]
MARWARGVVASAGAVVLMSTLAACSGPPEVESVDLGEADAAACRDFVDDLPGSLAGLDRVDVEPDDALGAAWGDPAIVVTCGAAEPKDFDEVTWACQEVEGVGWFGDPSLIEAGNQDEDITVWSLTHSPLVSVRIPSDYRPDGVPDALAGVATPLAADLDLVEPCLAPPD